MKELNENYLKVLDNRNWNVLGYTDDNMVELEWESPYGEDFIMCVEVQDFPQAVRQYYIDYDVDDHIEMWIMARRNGVQNVPYARQLVYNAEAIEDELEILAGALMR